MSSCLLMLLLVLDERVEEMKTRGFQNVDRTRAAGQSTLDARLRLSSSRSARARDILTASEKQLETSH
jgi:hypothetical protein